MKLIIAIIQPEALSAVDRELYKEEVYKITVSNAIGRGEADGFKEVWRGISEEIHLLKKVRLEIAVNENFVERTIAALLRGAKTGEVGDGKIFVLPLEDCIRIRTGEHGKNAIG
ncbi:MAG: P-II family nitrogen regulator [Candidatus Vecturithrix sp.]|jgi:nitrogen regulatory protein P-II 1|nr:P-II family nitrogen regulator [Candidatus Vecturithrix sp.]